MMFYEVPPEYSAQTVPSVPNVEPTPPSVRAGRSVSAAASTGDRAVRDQTLSPSSKRKKWLGWHDDDNDSGESDSGCGDYERRGVMDYDSGEDDSGDG